MRAKWFSTTKLLLLLAGASCVAYGYRVEVMAASADRSSEMFQSVRHAGSATQTDGDSTVRLNPNTAGTSSSGTVMGRLEIPALHISVPILSDYESSSLLKGVGHIPGTALPGGLGTLGLAGHRDTYFRPLRGVQRGMDIRVGSSTGVYHYRVDSTEIVTPDQVEVLAIRAVPELTLITCYPFYYVGAAPKRFIVHAHLLSALPDA